MSKEAKVPGSDIAGKSSVDKDEFKIKIFQKSDYPKTAIESIKAVLNLFLNFFR